MSDVLVFDTGPLLHFAKCSWVGILKYLTRDRTVVVPQHVHVELKQKSHQLPQVNSVLDASWISVDRCEDLRVLQRFAHYANYLVDEEGHNAGECAVLALGYVHGHTIVVDDAEARRLAKRDKLTMKGTLGLVCEAINEQLVPEDMASALADDLLESEYRLPFKRGEFIPWARNSGLLRPVI